MGVLVFDLFPSARGRGGRLDPPRIFIINLLLLNVIFTRYSIENFTSHHSRNTILTRHTRQTSLFCQTRHTRHTRQTHHTRQTRHTHHTPRHTPLSMI